MSSGSGAKGPGTADPGPLRRVVIAGGGTAGWLAAAYLNRALAGRVDVTLVESKDVAPIGVGEATVPTLATTMRFLGLEDADWMPEVNGTYKAAIRFVGWSKGVDLGGEPIDGYWHPFRAGPAPMALPWAEPYFGQVGTGIAAVHYALHRRLRGDAAGLLADQLLPTLQLCRRNLSPRNPDDPTHDVRTAYHLDAVLLGRFLRRLATGRGVERVEDHIVDVELDPASGEVAGLLLRSGRRLTADLYVDCTGFRSLLLGDALGEPFVSDAGHLLCDAAVALSAQAHDPADGLPPYTTSTALRHGWAWDIPLYNRRGCGYVHSSAFVEPDEAEAELRSHLGEAAAGAEARHLRFRVGRRRRTWRKNVVALGLSAAFLEPLESTSIFLIEFGLANLVTFFPDRVPDRPMSEARATAFNAVMNDVYDELRDFLILHYALANRRDTPFWRAAADPGVLTDSLAERLRLYEETLPLHEDRLFALFRGFSWACIVDGNGRAPMRPHPLLEQLGTEEGDALLETLRARNEACVASMPAHAEVVQAMHEAAS